MRTIKSTPTHFYVTCASDQPLSELMSSQGRKRAERKTQKRIGKAEKTASRAVDCLAPASVARDGSTGNGEKKL